VTNGQTSFRRADQKGISHDLVKRWADHGLYDVIGRNLDRLTPEETAIMLRILDHIHVVDRIFQHHLQELPHGFLAARSQDLPTFEALADSTREVDDWYASYVGGLAEDDFEHPLDFVFTSGKPARMRRGEIILHVCLHGTYHRGNAGAVLQLKGIAPSRDAITDFLEARPEGRPFTPRRMQTSSDAGGLFLPLPPDAAPQNSPEPGKFLLCMGLFSIFLFRPCRSGLTIPSRVAPDDRPGCRADADRHADRQVEAAGPACAGRS
jgi:uncharacterized damage-inducible protein DinB